MSQNSTGTFTSILIVAALTVASSDVMQQSYVANNGLSTYLTYENSENSKTSGMPIAFYNHTSGNFVRSMSMEDAIDSESIQMQDRHRAIEDSFSKYSEGFPFEKMDFLSVLSNSLCKLKFVDNISSYNESDFSLDTILKLSNGLKLSISQFLDEDIDSPVVFSIHRGKTLLISDEMPIAEIVNIINSVEAKFADEYEA